MEILEQIQKLAVELLSRKIKWTDDEKQWLVNMAVSGMTVHDTHILRHYERSRLKDLVISANSALHATEYSAPSEPPYIMLMSSAQNGLDKFLNNKKLFPVCKRQKKEK
jgi:hypothetical protein